MNSETAVARREPGILSTSTNEGWDLVARKAKALSESSVIPSDYRGNPQNVLVRWTWRSGPTYQFSRSCRTST